MSNFYFNVDEMGGAKQIGRINANLDLDLYLEVCDYDKYLWNSDEGERVLYGVKIALHLIHPKSTETIKVIKQNKLVDSEKISFKDTESKKVTFERYFRDKGLAEYKNDFVENEMDCCEKCGGTEGLHQTESGVVYAKCKCNLKELLSQEKCKK
ncbi:MULTISPECIES: hypothetical protein [Bacillus]|uniref:hypothetical protein n=1 Tax=Bacillus TaxID=1386 RepID=UPI001ABCAE40|nr:hypothetical protein [Bacillus subtilis]MBO3635106.1 hypothetical protein [Bacillus subtilis]